jgi:hypothetical protein
LLLTALSPSQAQSVHAEVQQLHLQVADGGILLSGNVKFDLSGPVEDALYKGIPMHFVAEAEVFRNRWYWADSKVGSDARHMRLSYQPLTRRWRLNVSPTAMGNSGLGVTLNQNFESLADALAVVQRFSQWRIADLPDSARDSQYYVEFSFRLDVSQLPRPFQIGAVGQSDWNLGVSQTVQLGRESNAK